MASFDAASQVQSRSGGPASQIDTYPQPTPSTAPTPTTSTPTPASTPTPTGQVTPTPTPSPTTTPWGLLSTTALHTSGNHIYDTNDTIWMGRGVNLYDTRTCDNCTYDTPYQAEVQRRIDALVDTWGVSFIRFDLDNFDPQDGRIQWDTAANDANYLANVVATVDYIASKPGVYVMVSLSVDECGQGNIYNAGQVPSATTATEWTALSGALLRYTNVIFGIGNEPSAGDAAIYSGMKLSVNAVRAQEDAAGVPHHLIAVQGDDWSRNPALYLSNPVLSDNMIYETHPYDPVANQISYFWNYTSRLPMIIGEFGYWYNRETLYDATYTIRQAEAQQIPWAAWSFHHDCGSAELQLLEPPSDNDSCGIGAPLVPTQWGQVVLTALRAVSTTAAISATNPAPGSLALAVQPNLCIAMPQTSGSAPSLAACSGAAAQIWSQSGNLLSASGACITATATNAANGTPLTSAACTSSATQTWVWYGNYLQLSNTDKCINLTGTTPAAGMQLTLSDCECTALSTTGVAANTICQSPANPFTQAWQAY